MKLLGINEETMELWIISATEKIADYNNMKHIINSSGYNPYDTYFTRLQKCIDQLGKGIEVEYLQYK